MRKFLIKAKVRLIILVFAFLGLIMMAGNISLAVNKKAIDEKAGGYFRHAITLGPIVYIFPNVIHIHDLRVAKSGVSSGAVSFTLPKISVRFAFWKFLFDGVFYVEKIIVQPSTINYYALSQFLEENFEQIIEFIKNSPGNNVKIRAKETLLDFDRHGSPDYVAMELEFALREDVIEGVGLFRTDQYVFPEQGGGNLHRVAKGWPLWYRFKGELNVNGIVIDHMIFKSGNLYSKLWGGFDDGSFQVNGFMFMDTANEHIQSSDYSFSRYARKLSADNELEKIDAYLLDIDGLVHFSFPKIEIERLNFSLNNIPVTLKGSLSLEDALVFNVGAAVRHPYPFSTENEFFDRAEARSSGTWKEQVLEGDASVDIFFADQKKSRFALDKGRLDFQRYMFRLGPEKTPLINMDNAVFSYSTRQSQHMLSLDQLEGVINVKQARKTMDLTAAFSGGTVRGSLWYDASGEVPELASRLKFEEVDTEALQELSVQFAKFDGRMAGTLNCSIIPLMKMDGDITIVDGRMTDLDFFNWVSNSFRIPSLKAVDFKRATAVYSIGLDQVQLYDIRLKTDDVHIKGYFNVDQENLVSSKLTVGLSQRLLSESSKFKPILKIFDQDQTLIDFDFQLSGSFDATNFQWLPSPVKQKIQTRIPDFVERLIEDNIDQMMDPVPMKEGE